MFGLLSSRQEIIERISFLSGCGHRFVLLSGDKGVGKSTIIEYLLESYFEEFVRKYVSVSPNINDIQVRSLILEAVFPDAAFDPEISLVKSFATHTQSEEEKFLVIDNGQNISEQVSAELLQLSLDPERFHLSILFASQNDSSNVKLLTEHSSVVSVNVDCLDLDESKQFLDYHFEELADDDLVTEFILKTGGHPQKLQKWDQRDTILDSASKDEPTESKGMNWRVPAIIVTALLGALGVQGYLYFQEDSEPKKMVVTQPKPKIAQPQEEAETPTTVESEQPSMTDSSENDNALAGSWNDDSETNDNQNTISDAEQLENEEITELSNSPTEESAQHAEQSAQAIAEREVEVTNVQATIINEVTPLSSEAEPTTSDANNVDSAETETPVTVSQGINIKSARWFNEQLPSSYFLQASGVSSTDTLEQFLRFEKIIDKTVVYETSRNGKPWFVVLFGPYDNADLARAAIADLPDSIQKLDPWAKSLTAIKRELPDTSPTQ